MVWEKAETSSHCALFRNKANDDVDKHRCSAGCSRAHAHAHPVDLGRSVVVLDTVPCLYGCTACVAAAGGCWDLQPVEAVEASYD